MAIIIAFGHKARQGKDTAVSYLMDKYSDKYSLYHTSFGKHLKTEVDELGPDVLAARYEVELVEPVEDIHCKTRWGKQARVLQQHGKARRSENPFYWVNKVSAEVAGLPKNTVVLISDMRNESERLWVEQEKGYTVNVRREGFIAADRDPNHDSECALDGYNYMYKITVPEGDLDYLKTETDRVFNDIIERQNPVRDEFITV